MHTATSPFPNSTAAAPRDLRSSSPALAGAGKFYEVTPEAVACLRQYWQQQATAAAEKKEQPMSSKPNETILKDLRARSANRQTAPAATAVPATSRAKNRTVKLAIDPAETYPASAIKAAAAEAAKDGRRNLSNILTDDVLAIWHAWNNSGKTMNWIAEHNGLLELNSSQVSKYLGKYRERHATASPGRKSAVVEPEPAAEPDPLPKPEIEPLQTAVAPFELEKPENLPTFFDRDYRPQPRPGDALGTLVQLLNDERITVKGSVEMNLRIEFGE